MRTSSNLRFSPRIIDSTVPLQGEANPISGCFLSTNMIEPAFMVSPSFTISLGTTPLKSVGYIAIISGAIVLCTVSSATP